MARKIFLDSKQSTGPSVDDIWTTLELTKTSQLTIQAVGKNFGKKVIYVLDFSQQSRIEKVPPYNSISYSLSVAVAAKNISVKIFSIALKKRINIELFFKRWNALQF